MNTFRLPSFVSLLKWMFRKHALNIKKTYPVAFIIPDEQLPDKSSLWFSDVFRKYRKRPVAWNRLIETHSITEQAEC